MWELINDVDMLTYELECATDNLAAIHSTMEKDEGANWQRYCNAVFSVYLQICNIRERLDVRTDQAIDEFRTQRSAAE